MQEFASAPPRRAESSVSGSGTAAQLDASPHVAALVTQRALLNSRAPALQFSGRGNSGKQDKSGGPDDIVRSYKGYVSTSATDEEILAAVRALLSAGIKLKKGHLSQDQSQGRNSATDKTNALITAKLREMKGDAKEARSRKGQRKNKYDVDEAADFEAPEKPFEGGRKDQDPDGGGGSGITA